MKLAFTRSDFPISIKFPFVVALVEHSFSTFLNLNGWFVSLLDFQASVILIWAFIWFTDSMDKLFNRSNVLTLSISFDPFNSRSILFCVIWIAFKSAGWGSSLVHLIFPRSCKPYLILDVKILSATFLRAALLIELDSLLSRKSLWFNEEIIPPFPEIWFSHFWSSSLEDWPLVGMKFQFKTFFCCLVVKT